MDSVPKLTCIKNYNGHFTFNYHIITISHYYLDCSLYHLNHIILQSGCYPILFMKTVSVTYPVLLDQHVDCVKISKHRQVIS